MHILLAIAGFVLVVFLLLKGVAADTCGDLLLPRAFQSGTLMSKNYPSNYPNKGLCIWLIKAPANYSVRLDLEHADLQADGDGNCMDYVEIRDGSKNSQLLFMGCNVTQTITMMSDNRWLWIKFYSGYRGTSTGFYGNYSLIYTGAVSGVNPVDACFGVDFQCRNKECVPYGYVCDNMNDCGCEGTGCDEAGCGGLGMPLNARAWTAIGTGVASFLVIFLSIGFLELWLKRKQEEAHRRQKEEEKMRSRRRRPPFKPKSSTVSSTVNELKLDIPKGGSLDTSKTDSSPKPDSTPTKLDVPKSPFSA